MAVERTLILIKPDAVQRSLTGEILGRFEKRGLKIVGAKLVQVERSLAEEHYAEHVGKPFLPGLLDFITSSPLLALVFEGERAIELARQTMGATDPGKAAPGSIRADFWVVSGDEPCSWVGRAGIGDAGDCVVVQWVRIERLCAGHRAVAH